jgi:hypothetical protein
MFTLALEPTKKTIMFRPLTFTDRRVVGKMYGGRQEGYTLEELLAAYALVQIDGQVVPEDWAADPITRFDNWTLPETQYYLEVFMTVCMLEDKLRNAAQEAAKKLMGSATTPSHSGTQSSKARRVDTGVPES